MPQFIPIEFQKSFEKTLQNSFKITAKYTEEDLTLKSHLGGYPFWQSDVEKPIDDDKTPMALLAQINFSDVPPNPDLPAEGILQLFIPKQDDFYGAKLDGVGSGKLITKFWENPDISKQCKWDENLSDSDLIPINGAHSMTFIPKIEYAGIDTIECAESMGKNPFEELEDVSLNEKEEAKFYENICNYTDSSGHKLLGYPFFLDNDPRRDSSYRLLLQIDTDMNDDNDIMWGDNGIGYIFIHNNDLKNHNFNNIWFFWDCEK